MTDSTGILAANKAADKEDKVCNGCPGRISPRGPLELGTTRAFTSSSYPVFTGEDVWISCDLCVASSPEGANSHMNRNDGR